ncbi:hypothetical protein SAMN05444484_108162 [Flavobacterium chilense]|uniref:Uncharacterized protein n=1 Tax=Flavobacterium chilense TaxID=946677 RepID=A0A1M7KWG2_9FLAO|nr:hypothetical protein SAMN05444484_108162 [Flavobacterium chilense]
MLSFNKKIQHLENYLLQAHENYANNLKKDIIMFIDHFTDQNKLFCLFSITLTL